jgi:hypothetical protein
MSHPLETRIGALRLRVRGWVAVYGLGYWLGFALAAVLLGALADYLVRFRDPGIRVLATLAVSGVLAWAAYRYLYLPWTVRLRDVDLARRVQVRYPSLGDDLASAVEFLRQAEDDPTAGSLSLRQAVVARATAATESLDFRGVIHPRPAWRAAFAAALVGILAAVVVVADPTSAEIAIARLTRPLADIPWPQVHHLVVRNPVERIARGQPFEAEVIDAEGTRLPAEVHIFYRLENPDGTLTEETEPMRLVHGMMVARRERVTRPLAFRVEGGDDRSMPWQPVEVVDPPAVASLRVTLTPPPYTGWPPEQSDGKIRALAGTRAEITASSTKPLVAAALLVDRGKSVPARIAGDGLQWTVPAESGSPWILDKSGSYGFRLTDREGISDGEDVRWEIRVVPDAPPAVALEEPGGGDNLFVTPQAVVPLGVSASDDLAVQRIDLQFTRSDRPAEAPAGKSLYVGPSQPKSARGLAAVSGTPDRLSVRYAWKLDELKLAPGTQVTFWAEAADYRPQASKSEPRRLSVVTPEDLAQRLASREAAILAELSRTLQMQRRGREQVAVLQKRAAEQPRLAQLELDQLRGAEINQRQIEHALSSRSEGVPMQVAGLLADLANTKLDPPHVRRRMETLLARMERLAAGELPAVGRELTAAIKAAQALLDEPGAQHPAAPAKPASDAAASVRAPMAAAGKHQDAIIAALEQMTGELSQWDRFRGFPRDVGQLAREQDDLSARTRDLARRTLTKQVKDLSPQEAAELAEAARRQAGIAGRFDAVEQAMDQAMGGASPGDPAAANVAEGLRRARELNLASEMRFAGDRIQGNQLGQATQQQGRVQEGLREVLDLLSGRARGEPAGQPAAEAEPSLENVKQVQEEINRRTRELEKSFGPSGKSSAQARRQYEALGREQGRLGELLQKLFAPASNGPPAGQKPAEPRGSGLPGPSPGSPQAPDPRLVAPPRPLEAIDRELFAAEPKQAPPSGPTAEPKPTAGPAAIVEQMLQAASRIRQCDAGPATQQLQRRIVAELEELLRQAGQDKSDLASQSTQKTGQNARPGTGPQSKPNANAAQTKPGPQPNPGQAASGGKSPGADQRGSGSRMSLLRRVWGDLPERQRGEILQLQPPEEFLPKYELQIEAYFRRLAEPRGE